MTDQKNTLLAIVLSAFVLIGWQYFIGLPQMEKQKQEAQLKQHSSSSSNKPSSRASRCRRQELLPGQDRFAAASGSGRRSDARASSSPARP